MRPQKILMNFLAEAVERLASRFRKADLSIFHEFTAPPHGGGNQFLYALRGQFQKLGFRVETNSISRTTRTCLFNSFNFDFDRLRRLARPGLRLVHRVDGPIGVYRGWDDGTDQRIWQINHDLADATIFQSRYSLNKHLELGLSFKSPVVIPNATDAAVFNPEGRVSFQRSRKIRLLSSSWSDNLNKGAPFYQGLEEVLDWDRFDYTFIGRSPIRFSKITLLEPLPSRELADQLRQHDIFVTASRNDPCSNSVIEAMACGLPCLYLDSGGHAELVQEAGLPFLSVDEALYNLNRLVDEYEARRQKIKVLTIEEVAARYLAVMDLTPNPV